jgi:enamine deaminase RidA (YjgF/YER057c/UK114 family)
MDFADFNRIKVRAMGPRKCASRHPRKYYSKNAPASTLVQVGKLAREELMIETEAVAFCPSSSSILKGATWLYQTR